ncbi:hypothetical protein L1049_024991 [Liquidambar formosana]|uniref:Uncharacterized protein n=1 Tax=Liquidambar formosana TaxID=63359 RepID=A0AAP0X5I4_LIQFO
MMAAQWTVTKPSRSDDVLAADQQLRIANQIRAHFDSMAPKRPTKPSRSESDSTTPLYISDVVQQIPELDKFRSLQSQSHAMLRADGGTVVHEEFVETQYYKELGSIDKQHYTTGTGFIKVAKEGSENGYDLQFQRGHDDGDREIVFQGFKSNPATNDWIPSFDADQVVYVSSKPNRSESC